MGKLNWGHGLTGKADCVCIVTCKLYNCDSNVVCTTYLYMPQILLITFILAIKKIKENQN